MPQTLRRDDVPLVSQSEREAAQEKLNRLIEGNRRMEELLRKSEPENDDRANSTSRAATNR